MCFPPPSAPAGKATDSLWCFPSERERERKRGSPDTLTINVSPQLAQSLPAGCNVTKTGKPAPSLTGSPGTIICYLSQQSLLTVLGMGAILLLSGGPCLSVTMNDPASGALQGVGGEVLLWEGHSPRQLSWLWG